MQQPDDIANRRNCNLLFTLILLGSAVVIFAISIESLLGIASHCKCAGCCEGCPGDCDAAFGTPLSYYYYGTRDGVDGVEDVMVFSRTNLIIDFASWVAIGVSAYWFLYRRRKRDIWGNSQ